MQRWSEYQEMGRPGSPYCRQAPYLDGLLALLLLLRLECNRLHGYSLIKILLAIAAVLSSL